MHIPSSSRLIIELFSDRKSELTLIFPCESSMAIHYVDFNFSSPFAILIKWIRIHDAFGMFPLPYGSYSCGTVFLFWLYDRNYHKDAGTILLRNMIHYWQKKHHRSDSWDDHTKIKKCASWFFSSLPNFHWFSFKKIKVFPSWKIEILLPASLCKLSQNYLFIYLFFISFFESED